MGVKVQELTEKERLYIALFGANRYAELALELLLKSKSVEHKSAQELLNLIDTIEKIELMLDEPESNTVN
jgi:hypothetical protein